MHILYIKLQNLSKVSEVSCLKSTLIMKDKT